MTKILRSSANTLARRVSNRFLATRVAEDVPLIRFLVKLSKKAKGSVEMDLAKRALTLFGWKIEDTKVALDLGKSLDGSNILESLLKGWSSSLNLRYIHYDEYDAPKIWTFKFNTKEDAVEGLKTFGREVTETANAPTSPQVTTLYVTPPSEVKDSPRFQGLSDGGFFTVKSIWMGVPGWTVTTASRVSVDIPKPVHRSGRIDQGPGYNLARFWTFIYKNGIAEAAQQYLDDEKPETVEDALRSKSERQQVERRRDASPAIEKVFREITDKKFQQVVEGIYLDLLSQMRIVQERQQETPPNLYPMKNLDAGSLMRMMERERVDDRITRKWVPLANHEQIAKNIAIRTASETREAFVYKNTHRVSAITKLKNNFKEATLLRVIAGHLYGGEIKFTFEDGSSFLLRNKTVLKRSSGGVLFAQFPTTFHEVVLPDGSKMSTPSEKRMIDVFAVAPAAS